MLFAFVRIGNNSKPTISCIGAVPSLFAILGSAPAVISFSIIVLPCSVTSFFSCIIHLKLLFINYELLLPLLKECFLYYSLHLL